MNTNSQKQTSTGSSFAPTDYTDGRPSGNWESRYPIKARIWIWVEFIYLYILSLVCLIAAIAFLWVSETMETISVDGKGQWVFPWVQLLKSKASLGAICALIGGTLGGCVFDLKWLYHSVAKNIWSTDRRLWRLVVPHISGVVALFFYLLLAKANTDSYTLLLGYSCLVGLFSDKALAKLAEIADNLFGPNPPFRAQTLSETPISNNPQESSTSSAETLSKE